MGTVSPSPPHHVSGVSYLYQLYTPALLTGRNRATHLSLREVTRHSLDAGEHRSPAVMILTQRSALSSGGFLRVCFEPRPVSFSGCIFQPPPRWGLPQGLFPSLRLTDALGREGVLQICRICQHLLLQTPDHTLFFWPASSCQNSTHSFISACRKGRGVPTASLCQRLPVHYPRYCLNSTLRCIRVPWRACRTPPQTF